MASSTRLNHSLKVKRKENEQNNYTQCFIKVDDRKKSLLLTEEEEMKLSQLVSVYKPAYFFFSSFLSFLKAWLIFG